MTAEWYYIGHYGQLGPLTREQFDELIEGGVILRDTWVWRAGMKDWAAAEQVTDLESAFGKADPYLAPPPSPMQPFSATVKTPEPPRAADLSPAPHSGYYPAGTRSDRSRVLAGFLQVIPGVGRIYLGYTSIGVLQLLGVFCGIGIIWSWDRRSRDLGGRRQARRERAATVRLRAVGKTRSAASYSRVLRYITPMRTLLLFLLICLAMAPIAGAQAYRPKSGETVVRLQIEGRGDVFILLHTKQAPRTANHIVDLTKSGFYDGQRFHRVENSPKPYLVQIGDPASKNGDLSGNGGSGMRIPYEDSGFTNVTGAVGLSRPTNDREAGDSQFYILLDRASFLDGNYTVFGLVVSGMEVLKKVERGDRVLHATIETG